MTSPNLKRLMMNLPRDHQKNVMDMVEDPYESHVFTISDEKAATLSQAATLYQISMKVDMVEEPAEPQEIKGELVSAMVELKDVLQEDVKVQGRNKNYYDVNEQVRQPNTNYIMVEPVYEKHVEAVDRQVQLLSLVKGNVMMLSSDSNDGEELEEGKVYIYVKKVVCLPTIKNIRVVNSVVVQYVAVKSAVVEDMSGVPLSLARESVTRDSSDYSDREEVLAEPEMRLVVFPPAQKQKVYEVAEQKGVEEYIVKNEPRDKEVKLGRRSVESCKMQRTRIFQLLSWGCIGWQQVPPIVFQFV